MDFSRYDLDRRHATFRDEVSAFLSAELTDEVLATTGPEGGDHHPGFFRALGAKGWIIPERPVEHGGAGLDFDETEILDALLAERGAPTINLATTRQVFPSIEEYAHESIRERVLAEVLAGEAILLLGYTEPDGGSDIADARTRATRDDDGSWIVRGSKVFTTGAHQPKGYIFLITLTDPAAKKGRGLSMFLVPLDTPGIQVDPILTLGERTNVVFFDMVLRPEWLLGEVDDGWAVLAGPLDAEHSLGGGRRRPHNDLGLARARMLGSALVSAAEVLADRPEQEQAITNEALGTVLAMVHSSAVTSGLVGRVHGSVNLIEGVDQLLDLLGPAATVVGDSPCGRVQAIHRRAQVTAIYGGTTEVFRNLIAKELGLPAQAYRV